MTRIYFLIIFFAFSCFTVRAQSTVIDSIKNVANRGATDSIKVGALNILAFKSTFTDSLEATKYLAKAEKISRKLKGKYSYTEMIMMRGILMDVHGNGDSAKFYFTKSKELSKKYGFGKLETRSTNNLGMYLWNKGFYDKALERFFEAMKLNDNLPEAERSDNSVYLSNIGLIYQEMDLFEKALVYHKKALNIRIKNKAIGAQAISYDNIGICYNALERFNEAIVAYESGLKSAKESGNIGENYKILSNLGNTQQNLKLFNEAIKTYNEALKNPNISTSSKIILYGNLNAAYNELKQPKAGIEYGKLGIKILDQNPDLSHVAGATFQYLAQSNYMLGNIAEGEKYNRKFVDNVKDNIVKDYASKAANAETRYETLKKEKALAESRTQLLENKSVSRQKNFVILGISGLALFIFALGLLLVRQQRFKNRQLAQEHDLKSAISQIETQNQLQEQRLEISRDLHDNIGAQLTFIISSVENIKYAFDVENPVLKQRLENITNFAKSTILELRDTIWAMNTNDIAFEDLRARILNFVEKAKDATSKNITFEIDDKLESTKLSSIAGMNIYRTIQEAVNNAIKHSNAKDISVVAKTVAQNIEITISDDGNGFKTDLIPRGNGLANMKKRIEEIAGIFEMESSANGTIVKITRKIT